MILIKQKRSTKHSWAKIELAGIQFEWGLHLIGDKLVEENKGLPADIMFEDYGRPEEQRWFEAKRQEFYDLMTPKKTLNGGSRLESLKEFN